MSQLRRVEDAWYDYLSAIAARTDSGTGTVDSGTTTTLVDTALSGTDWQWAVVEFTSGDNNGEWGVVTSWDDATDTCTFRMPFPNSIDSGDTYSIDLAPLGGATVYRRRIIPRQMGSGELPAVFVSAERVRTLEGRHTSNVRGSRVAILQSRTDLISAWDPESDETTRETSDMLFEQVDQVRLVRSALTGTATILTPDREEIISGFGELEAGQRVFWSTLWTPLKYAV